MALLSDGQSPSGRHYDQVVLLGDSLFQLDGTHFDPDDLFSFQAALQRHCMRRLDVINRGFSGWNTRNALEFLPEIVRPPSGPSRIEYLLVLLGANDACVPDGPSRRQHVPAAEYGANLERIMTHEHVRAHRPRKILLVTPPPLDGIRVAEGEGEGEGEGGDGAAATGQQQRTPSRRADVSAQYSQIARDVARRVPGTVLIDLQQALMQKAIALTPDYDPSTGPLGYPGGRRGGLAQLLPDGLHMSGAAYRVLFDLVEPHIGPFNGEEGYVFPPWHVVNPPDE